MLNLAVTPRRCRERPSVALVVLHDRPLLGGTQSGPNRCSRQRLVTGSVAPDWSRHHAPPGRGMVLAVERVQPSAPSTAPAESRSSMRLGFRHVEPVTQRPDQSLRSFRVLVSGTRPNAAAWSSVLLASDVSTPWRLRLL